MSDGTAASTLRTMEEEAIPSGFLGRSLFGHKEPSFSYLAETPGAESRESLSLTGELNLLFYWVTFCIY
jgi:hypothetical protein